MKRGIFLIIVILGGLIYANAQQSDSQGTPVPIKQLGPPRTGPRTSYASMNCTREPARLVVRDQEAWDKLWNRLFNDAKCDSISWTRNEDGTFTRNIMPAPEVDFTREMIVIAARGESPSGGYSIIIDKVYEIGDKLEVVVRSISQGSCMATTNVTRPVDIVRMAKTERQTVFREIKAVWDCKTGVPVIRDEP